MWMNLFLLYLTLLCVKGLQEYSDEFYECINPNKKTRSHSECTSKKIPETDGYKCCSMKISYEGNNSYSCFVLETEYTKNETILGAFMLNNSLASLFGSKGGQMEIDCGENLKSTQNYGKMSDEYLNCYKSHINGVDNENDCQKYNIPENEKSKCCFLESLQQDNEGNIINDKRCYIINDEYFTKEKNLNNYLLDKFNLKSLDQIKNINLTIKCKNYDIFTFKSKFEVKQTAVTKNSEIISSSDNDNEKIEPVIDKDNINKKKSSSSNAGIIAAIVIPCIVVLIGGIVLTIYLIKKRKAKKSGEGEGKNDTQADINNNQNQSNNSISNKNMDI